MFLRFVTKSTFGLASYVKADVMLKNDLSCLMIGLCFDAHLSRPMDSVRSVS